jgi:hypothetical protein
MTKEESAQHWENLANEQLRLAKNEEAKGLYGGAHRARAKTWGRCAKAIRLEIKTGMAHCTVCLGLHQNHECPKRPK